VASRTSRHAGNLQRISKEIQQRISKEIQQRISKEIQQRISKEIQEKPHVGLKRVIRAAAKYPAMCWAHPVLG
jgi:hypothetical protein